MSQWPFLKGTCCAGWKAFRRSVLIVSHKVAFIKSTQEISAMKNGSLHVIFTYRLFVFAALGAALPYNIKAFEKLSPDAKELVKRMAGIHLLK
jgi:hypothetical protein